MQTTALGAQRTAELARSFSGKIPALKQRKCKINSGSNGYPSTNRLMQVRIYSCFYMLEDQYIYIYMYIICGDEQ